MGDLENSVDNGCGLDHDGERGEGCVGEHIEKVLVVAEADARAHPGTVVVHFEHAPVALGAVVAPVGLCF